ncbi:MAG: putative metal-dependent hydrolase [Pseudomonadota bacterium]|jgi:probable rRNA maturation factor
MSKNPQLWMDVQFASELKGLPSLAQFKLWARKALRTDAQIALRITDEEEARAFNSEYRGKDYATNVLTFPLTESPFIIADILICAPVVAIEAAEQGKSLEAHFAHLTVHGVLHAHGYDHEKEAPAALMESLESQIMTSLGYPDPYAEIQ